eukprot:SAG22_NODE_12852_length_427_cov_0.786585_2_plen_73_part_01
MPRSLSPCHAGCLGLVFTSLTGIFVKLSPFTIRMLTIHRYFDIAKAREQLGYKPVVAFDEEWPKVVATIKARV